MKNRMIPTIEKLQKAIDAWLSPDNEDLRKAIEATVADGLFSFEDIKYQILALKKTLKKGELERWVEKAGASQMTDVSKQTVLCLHAGNVPLVGIQDILAVVLSGHRYAGKLSRKDPYLPASLLNILRNHDLLDGSWSADINKLAVSEQKADMILFSGSTDSVGPVVERLTSLRLAESDTPKLMRTAHYSIAFIEDDHPETFRQLANAVLRYGGSGCRSVAMVVAPFGLKSKKCEFTDYIESFWMANPQLKKPPLSLYHRFAYNKATGIEQSWLDDFLIEQTSMQPSEPFILHWVEGDIETLKERALDLKSGLQTIYVTDPDIVLSDSLPEPEMLSDAQQPPVWWKPDGVDPLKWLTER